VRVLVTGATGFVGYAVADRLRRDGHEVWGLARSDRPLPAGVGRLAGELADLPVLAAGPFDGVCHLAAVARVRESRADPVRYWRTNVGGTVALLEALAAQPGPPSRLVVASTCAVYGDDVPQPVTEDAELRPGHPYGAGKLAADRAVADVAATGVLGAISLRPFNVAGGLPGHPDRDETRLITKVVAVARGRGELTVNGDGSVVRDYLHVADMADAFARALGACVPGEWTAYNVGAGRGSTIAEVVATAEAVAGRRVPVRHGPAAVEPPALVADAGRIRRDLGWVPQRSDLRRIVADAFAASAEAHAPDRASSRRGRGTRGADGDRG
jgi:UDP-glucose 4-epimerase